MAENKKEKDLKKSRFVINLLNTLSNIVVIIAALLFPIWIISVIWKFSQFGMKAFSIPLSDNLELISRFPFELFVYWVIYPVLALTGIYRLIKTNQNRNHKK